MNILTIFRNWKFHVVFSVFIIINTDCVKQKSEWLKWQEAFNLAYPKDISCFIDMPQKTYLEGEPLIFRIKLINKSDTRKSIIAHGRQTDIAGGFVSINVINESNKILGYCPGISVNIMLSPQSERVFNPGDTIYINQIISPDLFRDKITLNEVALNPGYYRLECKIHLGTKFYPKPGRDLSIMTNQIPFHVDSVPEGEKINLFIIRPLMKEFFSTVESSIFSDSALYQLEDVGNGLSQFSPIAYFVYLCTKGYISTKENNKEGLDNVITRGKKFVNRFQDSILIQEMRINIGWWLYAKDSLSDDFRTYCFKLGNRKDIMNINTWELLKHEPIIDVR